MQIRKVTPVKAAFALTALGFVAPGAFADDLAFQNNANDGLWSTPSNWENGALPGVGDSAEFYLEDQANPLPLFEGVPTATLQSGTYSVDDIVIGGGSDSDVGDIGLRITGDAVLNLSGDSRIGRGGTNAAFHDSTASLILDGNATLNMTGGSGTDLKLSSEGANDVPNSYFSIRDNASFITEGTINFGRSGNPGGAQSIVFEIVGSNATIDIEDVKTEDGGVPGTIRWVLDAGGASILSVRDDFQMETLSFELELMDAPPAGVIVLAQADRLSNDNQFVGLPEDADVSAVFGSTMYTWSINYVDSSDDGVMVDAVYLDNLRTSAIPEPASLALLGMATAMLGARRRRS